MFVRRWFCLHFLFSFANVALVKVEGDVVSPTKSSSRKPRPTSKRFHRPFILFGKRKRRSIDSFIDQLKTFQTRRSNDESPFEFEPKYQLESSSKSVHRRRKRRDLETHPCIDLGWIIKKFEEDERKREEYNIDVLKKLKGLWILAAKESRKVNNVPVKKNVLSAERVSNAVKEDVSLKKEQKADEEKKREAKEKDKLWY